jgi:hypothetical protein
LPHLLRFFTSHLRVHKHQFSQYNTSIFVSEQETQNKKYQYSFKELSDLVEKTLPDRDKVFNSLGVFLSKLNHYFCIIQMLISFSLKSIKRFLVNLRLYCIILKKYNFKVLTLIIALWLVPSPTPDKRCFKINNSE